MILDEIIKQRRIQLQREKQQLPLEKLKPIAAESVQPGGRFYRALNQKGISVIAEVKKASPSKGLICSDFQPIEIAKAYQKANAAAISCLTEEYYFQGGSRYFQEIRKAVAVPMLRKDFIIDPYQIYEASVLGADAVLLIASVLSPEQLKEFLELSHDLGLDCLVEVHTEEELEKAVQSGARIIGINNRNLKTFEVTLETTKQLICQLPDSVIKVSESGISNAQDIAFLQECGADAVLIGETLMRSGNIAEMMNCLLGKTEKTGVL